ncbi:MAG: DUF1016 N-terminal domain-containing protein [Candidatus Omnitrophica bacterium]|nr:DUF1016 N-terminal domain-containing protein [Candidatus Omnitrophota bacterium]MDD5670632.1 DUF1016 N-terminal domain-containing protein [Candidatus Omnitrophota bacterium]
MPKNLPGTMPVILILFLSLLLPQTAQSAAAENARQAKTLKDPGQPPKVETYEELLQAVRRTRTESRERLAKLAEQEKLREAWQIGKLIDTHILRHKERADYAASVMQKLAGDTGISMSELYFMLEFARLYPIFPTSRKLSWGHYRELLSVHDEQDRQTLIKQAEAEGWSVRDLRRAVRKIREKERDDTGTNTPEVLPLTAKPGITGTYRVVRAQSGPEAGDLVIDLGFSNYYKPAGPLAFQDRQIIHCKSGDCRPAAEAQEGDLFTYEAYLVRVLDGDTVSMVIDLGFGFRTVQTLRLRGLDAAEIMTNEGQEAKKALEEMLGGKGPVLVRTTRSDKYDRYLADIFANGDYVNQKLIEGGYAVQVEG